MRENMEKKIKILGIAPYEGMKSIMTQLAQEREDLELDVFIGDLEKGAEIVRRNSYSNYDAIISRGGTAELIGRTTHLPVIEVNLSVYDILRAIKLAETYADLYAIVGFPGITGSAHLLCDLLQYHIDIFTVHDTNEVYETLQTLKNQGYRMVLCDMIANTVAKRLGLNAILITSGSESVSAAFDQAVKLCRSYSSLKEENQFLQNIIRSQTNNTLVLCEDGEVFFSSLDEPQLSPVLDLLKKELPSSLNKTTHKFFKNIDGTLYSFTGQKVSFNENSYIVYCFSATSIPIASSKYGIQYFSCEEAEDQFFYNFYTLPSSSSNLLETMDSLNHSTVPVMIFGETGSGKEQIARSIYSKSQLKNNPLIVINCALLSDKSWNFITNHYNSPFNDSNNTIFIKDIIYLSEHNLRQLLSIIVDTNLCQRNRMIFSCVCPPGKQLPTPALDFVNLLSCVTIYLPPLRERAEEIPALSSLYLNMLNVTIANQIIGFEPEGMKMFQEYDWPYNYTQFKRALHELALITKTPYIRTDHVAAFLEKERSHITPLLQQAPASPACYLEGTLDEINQKIIRLVLEQHNGNQSAAAKQLGISRTTLWRYLKYNA
ncbi:MAG: PrpR N-terminal domain-containing protein [bacterium]|nr:PrpR N-terminal domain-containing protein [bacterium]